MNLKDVHAKVNKGETLADEEKKFLEEYKEPDVQGEVDRKAKAIKKEAEDKANAKISELETQLKDLQTKLEEKDTGNLSEVEKLKKDLEKATKEKEAHAKEVETLKTTNSDLQRNHAIDGLFAGLSFVEGIDKNDMRVLFSSALGDVKLDDEEAVKEKVDQFTSRNKALLAASGPSGAGTKPGEGSPKTPTQVDPTKQTDAERMKDINKPKTAWG